MQLVKKKNNCDIILNGIEDTFVDLGECFESCIDEKQTKFGVLKNIFKFGSSLIKLTFNTTTCVVKNIPKAVVVVAGAKREIVNVIEDEFNQYKREQKEDALNERIKQLKLKA